MNVLDQFQVNFYSKKAIREVIDKRGTCIKIACSANTTKRKALMKS